MQMEIAPISSQWSGIMGILVQQHLEGHTLCTHELISGVARDVLPLQAQTPVNSSWKIGAPSLTTLSTSTLLSAPPLQLCLWLHPHCRLDALARVRARPLWQQWQVQSWQWCSGGGEGQCCHLRQIAFPFPQGSTEGIPSGRLVERYCQCELDISHILLLTYRIVHVWHGTNSCLGLLLGSSVSE